MYVFVCERERLCDFISELKQYGLEVDLYLYLSSWSHSKAGLIYVHYLIDPNKSENVFCLSCLSTLQTNNIHTLPFKCLQVTEIFLMMVKNGVIDKHITVMKY